MKRCYFRLRWSLSGLSIFLLMLFITRYAAHEHDSEAQAEAKREEQAQAASAAWLSHATAARLI